MTPEWSCSYLFGTNMVNWNYMIEFSGYMFVLEVCFFISVSASVSVQVQVPFTLKSSSLTAEFFEFRSFLWWDCGYTIWNIGETGDIHLAISSTHFGHNHKLCPLWVWSKDLSNLSPVCYLLSYEPLTLLSKEDHKNRKGSQLLL